MWPLPPASPKIRFLRTLAGPQDLAAEPTLFGRIGELLFGVREEWLVRPTGVAVEGSRLWVADPGGQAVHLFDLAQREHRTLRAAGRDTFLSPVGVTGDGAGGVYVADSALGRVFHLSRDEDVLAVITQGLARPTGLAFSPSRKRLYVADTGSSQVLLVEADRIVRTIGRRGTGPGEFNYPTSLLLDPRDFLYVVDSLNFRIQILDPEGRFVSQFGKVGDGSGDLARPKGVGVDREGHVYVVDALFDAVQIFTPRGEFLLGFGERGTGPGQFWLPAGLAFDGEDRIYVADSYNQRIQIFQYLKGGEGER